MPTPSPAAKTKPTAKFHHAILGGTFDHFHAGHAHFINTALKQSKNLTIGLASSGLVKKKPFPDSLESYSSRLSALKKFIQRQSISGQVRIIAINDIFGTSLTDQTIDTIFVTDHGLANAKIINRERAQIDMPPLKITKVPYLRGEDGETISSTRIRAGEIDHDGNSYLRFFYKTLYLPESLRSQTKNIPKGKLIRTIHDYRQIAKTTFVIAVGDIASIRLVEAGRQADISIVDYKVARKPIRQTIISPTLETKNDPGTINRRAVLAIKEAINKAFSGTREVIEIIGEEDLLALAATLLSPLGSIIFYGRPGKGAVAVEVTEQKKREVLSLVSKFKRSII